MIRLETSTLATLAACALLASCGTGSDGSGNNLAASESTNGVAPLSQRLNEAHGYVQDANGKWVPRNNRRSQFENRTASGTNQRNTFEARRFNAAEYQPAEWTRTRSNTPQPYSGDTDGSTFQSTAAAQGRSFRESSTRARTPGAYETSGYRTGASRENSARRHDRPADARVENRRQSPIEPEIIDWRQQRDLAIDQTRSMLAR